MSRRKKIDPSILKASEQFDAQTFIEAIRGSIGSYCRESP
jgi:hypothetical protein